MYRKIHSPRPKRFPKGGDFAPRGPRDCPRAKPEGNLEGRGVQNPRPREISRAEGGVFPNASRLEAVYGHSLLLDREGLELTLSICHPYSGGIFRYIPLQRAILTNTVPRDSILGRVSTNTIPRDCIGLYSIF